MGSGQTQLPDERPRARGQGWRRAPRATHPAPSVSAAPPAALSPRALQMPKGVVVQSGRASEATEASCRPVGHLPFPARQRARVREDSRERPRVVGCREGDERSGRSHFCGSRNKCQRSRCSVRAVSFGSLFLIIRANYVPAKGEHVPKFTSLCATTTMRVLCASP